ncbi:MAG: exodeoxyribonuclease VII large subunit, partial [Candidatus Competibacterales bacterium]|nr:exodeoxyribonuclease VII large subunit [Candidatus Competibacterales bacterium]
MPQQRIYRVSELNREVRQVLETGFPLLTVEGELSNLSRPASGHLYFTLKDATAQVRCALFRNRARLLARLPVDGQQVRVRARLGLYEARGEYQLIVESLAEAGEGALQQAFEALRQRLQTEGLFAAERKRGLPRMPRRIGVITSPTGAAMRDVLSVLARRFPALPVRLYPTPVQGAEAPAGIVRALEQASERRDCDLLLLVRGGGSLEDLQAFNDERVARAIVACAVPVVSGVGHETDVTIADFAADRRAPTPSAAAELVSPDRDEWRRRFEQIEARLVGVLRRSLIDRCRRLDGQRQRLGRLHPRRRLEQQAQHLDELEQHLRRTLHQRLERGRQRLDLLRIRLQAASPRHRLRELARERARLAERLTRAMTQALTRRRQRLEATGRALNAVSPLAVLGRGYAILRDPRGEVVRRAAQVGAGERLEARLARGR